METQTTNGTTNGTSDARTSGRCPANGTIHLLSDKEKAWRKTKCPTCGKDIAIKDNHFTDDFKGMMIPNHNRVVVELPTPPPPLPVAPSTAVVDTAPPRPGDTVMRSPDGDVTVLDRAPLPIVDQEARVIAPTIAVQLFRGEVTIDTGDVIEVNVVATNMVSALGKMAEFAATHGGEAMSIRSMPGELIVVE